MLLTELCGFFLEESKLLLSAKAITQSTYKTYLNRLSLLHRFLDETGLCEIAPNRFDARTTTQFIRWVVLNGYKGSTTGKTIDFIRQIHTYNYLYGTRENNPLNGYKARLEKSKPGEF